MLQEVSGNIGNVRTDFPLINAVLLGKQHGRIFTGNSVLFVLHKSGFSFLQVSTGFDDYKRLTESILKLKDVPSYLHFYSPPQELIDECGESRLLNIKIRKRVHLSFAGSSLIGQINSLPEGYSVQKISEQNFKSLSIFNLDISNKFWSSKEDFLTNGFGFFVSTISGEPAAICYTACVGNDEAEIDIATLEHHQRKGLGKATAYAFVQYCINNGIVANWDCFETNTASINLADSLGFQPTVHYSFLSVFKK